MWTTDQLGIAVWHELQSTWCFDTRGGEFGIGMLANPKVGTDTVSVDQRFLSLLPVDAKPLPAASEQYVRGRRYFVNYPQGDGHYAIRLALEPIETFAEAIVIEATISIQTDLLDTHPMLDLVAEGQQIETCDSAAEPLPWPVTASNRSKGASPISVVSGAKVSTSILLGPHDSPFTSDRSSGGRLCLRLFGDFLEKGVIRTARPWIAVDRSGNPGFRERLGQWHQQLSESPLPLSS